MVLKRKHVTHSGGTLQKKHRGVKKAKPSKKPIRSSRKFNIHNVQCFEHDGFTVSLPDYASIAMWNALTKRERSEYVEVQKNLLKERIIKPLLITYEADNGLPIEKTIYVRYEYQGDGSEFKPARRPDTGKADQAGE